MGDTTSPGSLLIYGVVPEQEIDALRKPLGNIIIVNGNPSGLLSVPIGSQIAYDPSDGRLYLFKTGLIWCQAGSRTFT